MLQNLREEIRECLHHVEECKRMSRTALLQEYLEMERRWLALVRSNESTERLSRFTEPFKKRDWPKR
jgi:hypothetical protein